MKIGIFGGTFNPPHLGHLLIAELARESQKLDEIWFIPTGNPPHKKTQTPSVIRYAWTKIACADNPFFKVLDIEVYREGYAYTIDTLSELQKNNPEHQFYLIIGGDSLRDFHLWKNYAELLTLIQIICYKRPHIDLSLVLPQILAQTIFLEAPLIEISSTQIRERIASGKSIRYQIPNALLQIIGQSHNEL